MSDQTVSSEVARLDQASAAKLVGGQLAEFSKILPAHVGAERFARWALTVLRKPELQEALMTDAGRLSVMSALMDCASLGLEVGREYHLLPFGGSNRDGSPKPVTVTGVTDYKGEIRLIQNAQRCAVVAELVYRKDTFRWQGSTTPPVHEADWFGERGDLIGGFSYVDFGGGLISQVITMTETEFLKHREKARGKAIWDEWPEAMRRKTEVHQVRKFVPWSPEWRQ